MPYKTQEQVTEEARTARFAENEALLDKLEEQTVQAEKERKARAAKKRPSLEKLLASFDKSEKLREETEALRPRLEKEIIDTIASGEALDEKLANSLATRRGMLEMIPAKLDQIHRHQESLKVDINEELGVRFTAFEHRFDHMHRLVKGYVDGLLRPLMADDYALDHFITMHLVGNTKLNRRVVGLLSYIRHPMAMGNPVVAARALIAREAEADAILAEADKLTILAK